MSTKSLAKQRERFWKANPHCYYCGVKTILKGHHKKDLYTDEERDILATIDHIRPRHHPDRLQPQKPGEQLHVLSCWRCNNERDKRELAEKPKEWFEQNGGAKPLHKKSLKELEYALCKISQVRPRGRGNKLAVKRSQIAVLWAWWERGMDT